MTIKSISQFEENGVKLDCVEYTNGTIVCTPTKIVEPYCPTQLDRIETSLSNTFEEIRAEARDEYTLSLIENGII